MSQLRVLVTGGSRGIGRAIALRFAREGSKVVVAARTSAALDGVVAEIDALGGRGLAAQMDVAEHGSVEAAVFRSIQFTGGGLDVLVNNAAVSKLLPFAELDPRTWSRMLEVNLTGPFLVTRETLDALAESERPHVFHVCCEAGRRGLAGATAYCASKYGLRGFADALRVDLAEKRVRVTSVYPPASGANPEAVADAIWNAYQTGGPDELDVSG